MWVYKIRWHDYGETGRLDQDERTHQKYIKSHKANSDIANHAWANNHSINFDGEIIGHGSYRTRKTLELWHTALDSQADNNSKPLPEQYFILIKK